MGLVEVTKVLLVLMGSLLKAIHLVKEVIRIIKKLLYQDKMDQPFKKVGLLGNQDQT
jgi:hypothetical protein